MQIVNVNGFDKILMDHDDINVAKTVLYGKMVSAESMPMIAALYTDSNYTVRVTRDQLTEAYYKGCEIMMEDDPGQWFSVTPTTYFDYPPSGYCRVDALFLGGAMAYYSAEFELPAATAD
jgi:hypothetical protein